MERHIEDPSLVFLKLDGRFGRTLATLMLNLQPPGESRGATAMRTLDLNMLATKVPTSGSQGNLTVQSLLQQKAPPPIKKCSTASTETSE